MFSTFILQYLNKLVEGKVGDLASPKPFHAVKVQGFKGNRIKLLTKFTCQLPVKIFALVADFPIQTCELPDTPPPTVRTFLFTRKFFVERPKFVQGVFQRFGVLYFLTRAKGQIRVFHAEVCPNAFTCCWQRSKICVCCCYAEPIVPAIVSFDCDTTDSSMPLAVFMKRIWHFIKSPFTFIPLAKCQCNTVVSEFIPSLFKSNRLKLMARFDMGFTPKFSKEPLIRIINAFQLCLDRLAWQHLPMWMCGSFQIFSMLTHCSVVGIRQAVFVSLVLPLMKICMHLPHIVKQVANADCIRLIANLIFVGFHGISRIASLTFNQDRLGTDTPCSVLGCVPNAIVSLYYKLTALSNLFHRDYAFSGKPISQS